MSATDELVETLLREKEIYSRLLSASEEKEAAIIGNQREKLQEILGRETDLIAEAGGLEKQRSAITETLARRADIEASRFCLSALAERTEDPAQKDRLTRAGADFSDVLEKLAARNRTNAELLKKRREYTAVMLDAILGGGQPCGVYDRTGSAGAARARPGLIDRQV